MLIGGVGGRGRAVIDGGRDSRLFDRLAEHARCNQHRQQCRPTTRAQPAPRPYGGPRRRCYRYTATTHDQSGY
jgi:hypothetical protein